MRFVVEVLVTLKPGLADPAGQGGGRRRCRRSGGRTCPACGSASTSGSRWRRTARRRRAPRSRRWPAAALEPGDRGLADPGDPGGPAHVSAPDRGRDVPRFAGRSRRPPRGRADGRGGRAALARRRDLRGRGRGHPPGRLQLRRLPAVRRDRRGSRRSWRRSRRSRRGAARSLGICNGFQILCESGLLPGALIRNRSLRFVCRVVCLRVETTQTPSPADSCPARSSRSRSSTGRVSSSPPRPICDRLEGDGPGRVPLLLPTARSADDAQPERRHCRTSRAPQRGGQRGRSDAASGARGGSRRRADRRPGAVRVAARRPSWPGRAA